ncbi:MAG: hypothetical protein CMJ49_02550 [Planctomycetaceae bacterium]|nr:hypothetical protein [Planctomycetaceae bacterium]
MLGAGQLASVAVHNLDAGAATVDLIDTDGVTLLASGLPATNASAIIDGFIAPAGGTYFVRVNGDIDTDYSLTAPRDAQFEVEDNNTDLTGQQLVMQPNGGSSSGLVLGGGDIATSPDVFLVSLTAGDVVNVLTTTPFDGPGEAPNTFDPRVFLFNPSGFLVAFNEDRALGDHNAEVNWVAGETGTFVIQLEGTGIGPYLLQVDQTPTALDVHPTPTVVSTIPGDGGSVANAPTTLTLQFSEGMLANSFDLSDLSFTNPSVTVDTVTVLNGNTVEYGITVPNVEGTYDYTFAAASASDLQGTGNLEHQGSFLIDQTGPMVVATTPSTQASAPFNNLTFIFNEDIDPASVDLSDVASFSGPGGPLAGALTGISVLNNKMTVTFADQNTVGIYTMTIGPNLTDLGGNAMDQDGGAGSSDAFTVQLSLESPDLRVQTVDPLAAAQFGDQIDVTYSVINSGTDPAQNTWVDRIFLSTDNVLDVSDTELATVPQNAGQLGPLNDGDSYNRTESVTLPLDLNSADGVYFIIVETDADLQQAESNETNNTNVQPINLTVPPLPDLVVTNIVAPTQSDSGEDVQIQWTITNQGTGDFAGTFEDRLWLSTNNSLGGDQFFGDFSFTGTINAGDSIVRVQNITLPLTQSGDRWVIIQTDVDNVVFEGGPGEANNTTIDDVQIDVSLAPFPNLVVTSVTPPPAADSGQTVLVEWTVQNQGLGDTTTPTWYDRVYLSVDTQFDGSDIFLGQTTNPSFLAAGDSYLNSLNVNLPLQQAGDFHFVVRTDVFDQVEEHLDEGDNDGFGGPIPIALPPLPDLEIEETSPGVHNIFTIPPTGLSGQPITVNWTGVNSGTGATSGAGWWDAVYLSTDMVLDGSDTFLGQRVVSPGVLNPTDTYSASLAVNLPVGVEGALFLIVDVDRFNHVFEGALEDNNSENFDPLPVNLTPPPDLAVTTVNADDTVLSGFPLSIDYTVINQGATTTPNTFWIDQFFLSTDAVFDPGTDTVLGTKWHSGSLTPFASYSDTATFTIPADTPSGSFHVFVRTDFDDRVFEGFSTPTSVDNNIGFDPVLTNIDFQPADLTVVPLSVVAPLSAETGESIVVDWTVENVGTGPTHTGIWQDRIFLSADAVIDGADPIIGTLTHNGALAAGGQAGDSYDATLNVTIPFATAPGNYQLLVLTDRANQLFESNELNNVGNRPITITQNLPDLQISALSDPPAALNGGDALVVNWTVQNLGSNQTNVNTWLDRVYLSVDQTLSVDDVDLGATRRSNPLPGYGGVGAPPEYSTGRTANLPTDLDGTFYVIVQTDDQDAVIEGAIGETNNVAVSTTQVTVSPIIPPVPDLAVTLVDAPTAATSGQVFSLTFDVTNNGDDTPVRSLRHIDVFGGWYDAVYLSADQVFDPMTDAYLGFVNFVDPNPGTLGLANGESYSVTHDFTVPNGVSGNQYVFVNADRGNAVVNEATELNNVAYDTTAMNVTLPDPVDLVVESIVVPAAGTPGVLTSIDYTVRNLSPTVTATGSWRDTLYLSSDTTFDITDPVIGSVIVGGPVGPNATYTRTLNATLPAVTPGNYHVLVRTDILNQVLEVDETNNLGASITTMNADALALTLDVPFNGTLFEGQATFFRIDDVPAGETMRVNLDGDPDTASNQLFVSYGEVPTRTNFDFRFDNPFSADQQIIVPATRSGTYFVQLFGDDEPQPGGGTYDILADILGFELLGVTPDRGSNLGTATVIIDGSKISHDSDIQLVDTGGTITDAINTWWVNEAEVWATFDLQGLATGLYDVQVDDGVTTAVLPDAFEVTSDPAGQVEVDISGPAAVRPGRSGTVSINYANSGQTDVLAPIITLNVTNAVVGVPGAPGLFTDTLTFLGVNDMGPAGILAPGATASIALPFSPTASGGEMVFDLDFLSESMPEAALPIDWEASRAELMPITIDINAWDVIYDNYVASIGTTGADYLQVLSENASHLSMLGQRTNSLSGIQAFEIVQAAGLATIPVLAAAVDSSVAAPGRDLSITRTYANSIATRHEIGPYGYGWTHNYQRSLNSLGDGTVLYTDVIGGTQWFFPNGDGTYSDLNPTLELVQLPDATWQMTNQANTVEAYDPSGQLVSITDNNGNQITTTYTGGQLTRLDHSSGQFIDITYDGFGNIDSMTDSVGQTTTFGYDPSGQYLTSSTNAYSRVTTYTYDTAAGPAQHALTSITQPNSLTHTFFYNAQGHLSAFEGEAGDAHVDLIQDNVGTVHVVDLFGTSASIVFDDAARQARVVDTLGSVFQSQVDSLGQVIETVDALNRVTTYDVDDRSNITEILNAAGQDLEFVFDASTFGSLTESIDANRISTLHLADIKHGYPADGNGNPDQRIMDDGTFEFFTYNAEGQIQTQTNRRGQVITYGYDTDGNLTSKAYDDGTVFTYTYDAHGNQLTTTGLSGTITRTYDVDNNLIRVDYTGGSFTGQFVEFDYDVFGRRTQTLDHLGNELNASYDALGRLEELTDASSALVVGYTYDALSRVSTKTLANGVVTNFTYDSADQVTRAENVAPDTVTIQSFFDYTYDAAGQITAVSTHQGDWTYTYDAVGQLVGSDFTSANPGTIPDQQFVYTYDAIGNRTSSEVNGVVTNYTSNNLHQYTDVGANVDLQYDADGNLTQIDDGGVITTLTYNHENRLTSVDVDGGTDVTLFEYDANGRLTSVTENGVTRVMVQDPSGLGSIIGEYDPTGLLLQRFDYSGGLLRSEDGAGVETYYGFNATSHTSELTDATGVITDTYLYDPFGQIIDQTGSSDNGYQYAGELGVLNTGPRDMQFMRNRFYLPELGQFITEDPLRFEAQNNRTYVNNNPINGLDPIGLVNWGDAFWAGVGFVGSTVEAAAGVAIATATGVTGVGAVAGGAVAVHGAYGMGANAGNFINALFEVEPTLSGNMLQDVGMGVDAAAGTDVFENLGLAADLGIGLATGRGLGYLDDAARPPGWVRNNRALMDAAGDLTALLNSGNITQQQLRDLMNELNEQAPDGVRFVPVRDGDEIQIQIVRPSDPNDIVGPEGFGDERFVPADQPLDYRVRFENMEVATAPAQEVFVTMTLDPDLDFTTFRFEDFGFGDLFFDLPGTLPFVNETVDYTVTIDEGAGPVDVDILVNVFGTLDVTTGDVLITFTSLDPSTGALPDNPLVGFLPPNNDDGIGDAFFSYRVTPRSTAVTGDVIDAEATIVFDTEGPIATPPIFNTLDAVDPTSNVLPLAATQTDEDFLVQWTGSDDTGGSGVAHYTIYVSTNGAPFELWLDKTTLTESIFDGKVENDYAFYSVAEDNAGNTEDIPATADASTSVPDVEPPRVTEVRVTGNGWGNPQTLADGAAQLAPLGTGQVWTVQVVFSEDVVISQGDVSLVGATTAVPPVANFSYDSNTFTASLDLQSYLQPDTFTLTVADTVIDQAPAPNALDGDWTDGVSTYDSGDGTAGGSFEFDFNILPGDATGDGTVDAGDMALVGSQWGTAGPEGDLNRDGIVDIADLAVVGRNFGSSTGPSASSSQSSNVIGLSINSDLTPPAPANDQTQAVDLLQSDPSEVLADLGLDTVGLPAPSSVFFNRLGPSSLLGSQSSWNHIQDSLYGSGDNDPFSRFTKKKKGSNAGLIDLLGGEHLSL